MYTSVVALDVNSNNNNNNNNYNKMYKKKMSNKHCRMLYVWRVVT